MTSVTSSTGQSMRANASITPAVAPVESVEPARLSLGPALDAILQSTFSYSQFSFDRGLVVAVGGANAQSLTTLLLAQTALFFAGEGHDVFYAAEPNAEEAKARLAQLPDGRFSPSMFIHGDSGRVGSELRRFPCSRVVVDRDLRAKLKARGMKKDVYHFLTKARAVLIESAGAHAVDVDRANIPRVSIRLFITKRAELEGGPVTNFTARISRSSFSPLYAVSYKFEAKADKITYQGDAQKEQADREALRTQTREKIRLERRLELQELQKGRM